MIATILLTVALFALGSPEMGAPGDGLGLVSGPVVGSPLTSSGTPLRGSTPRNTQIPGVAAALAAGVGIVALSARAARRRDDEPFYVIVHGNGGDAEDFDELLEHMGVGRERVAAFDYRLAAPGASSTAVSRTVDSDQAAVALDRFLRGITNRHHNVYSIHHSKGAAVGVIAIAALDEGSRPPIDGYRGAALLDPPIADLPLGPLQRLGTPIPMIADNGGFDPIRCDDGGCRDIREHLGSRAGVEVVAIRNPDAEITNFTDEPDGLRVYDLADDGGPSAWALAWNPYAFLRRVFEAHSSVLRHPAGAGCIVDEVAEPGSCDWKGVRRVRRSLWGRGNGKNLVR